MIIKVTEPKPKIVECIIKRHFLSAFMEGLRGSLPYDNSIFDIINSYIVNLTDFTFPSSLILRFSLVCGRIGVTWEWVGNKYG